MADPKTLADKPVADRRGDDVLDRHVAHVIDHPEPVVDNEDDDDLLDIIEDADGDLED